MISLAYAAGFLAFRLSVDVGSLGFLVQGGDGDLDAIGIRILRAVVMSVMGKPDV